MKYDIMDDGKLRLTVTSQERDLWIEDTGKEPCEAMFSDIMDDCGMIGNGWYFYNADAIGALSEAPIISNDTDILDDGVLVCHSGWYDPAYAIRDFVQVLFRDGSITLPQLLC